MLSLIESPTSALLSLAFNAATLRQQAISHNIANAGQDGFRALAVSFEDQLAGARDALSMGRAVMPSNVANVAPALDLASPGPGGNDAVSLDMQLAQLSENALHHQALLKALNRHYALLGIAINEGKH
jgi:flagellar basal-body rod protein FlgB